MDDKVDANGRIKQAKGQFHVSRKVTLCWNAWALQLVWQVPLHPEKCRASKAGRVVAASGRIRGGQEEQNEGLAWGRTWCHF